MTNSATWLRNLARNYADGVPGMTPEQHHAWAIADEIEALHAELNTPSFVDDDIARAVAAERERCCQRFQKYVEWRSDHVDREEGFAVIAAIRKGGATYCPYCGGLGDDHDPNCGLHTAVVRKGE
jgi:hypothetical protein